MTRAVRYGWIGCRSHYRGWSVPLREDLRGIGQRILDFHRRGGEPPYLLYVYPPTDEWGVRRDLKELQLWLEAPDQGIHCAAISLAELFWQALEAEGWIDELIAQEIDAAGDETALPDIFRSVSEILRLPPSLPDRPRPSGSPSRTRGPLRRRP